MSIPRFVRPPAVRSDTSTVRLFCIPYAGGSASVFRQWQDEAPSTLQVCPIELPGRGRLCTLPLPNSVADLATQIALAVRSYASPPTALFGYSMGAIIAFEVARRLEHMGAEICHLFACASPTPGTYRGGSRALNLSDEELLSFLRRVNGTPHSVLEDGELMSAWLPVLKGDIEMLRRYLPPALSEVKAPITTILGQEDPYIDVGLAAGWKDYTSGSFKTCVFPGDHFFINSRKSELLAAVVREVTTYTTN